MIAKAQFTIKDLNDIWPSPVPPSAIPPVGFMWRNTSVNPNELIAWNGKGTDVARTYSATKSGAEVSIEDLGDDRNLNVTALYVTQQASGTPTLTAPLGLTPRDYVGFAQQGETSLLLYPSALVCGLPSIADSATNLGVVTHNTGYASIDGNSSWSDAGNVGATTKLYKLGLYSTTGTSQITYSGNMCNRAVDVGSQIFSGGTSQDAGSTFCVRRVSGENYFSLFIRVPKALCANLTAFKTWLNANPLQVVFRRETPVIETLSGKALFGIAGANLIASNGTVVSVSYTGSGWEAVGSVQRISIEAVEMTPELGIKVAHVLTDGTDTKNVYTLHNSKGFSFFDADTGELLGGLVMMNGEVFLFASALADPRVLSTYSARIVTEEIAYNRHRFGIQMMRGDTPVGSMTAQYDPNDPSAYSAFPFVLSGENKPVIISVYKYIESSGASDSYAYFSIGNVLLKAKWAATGGEVKLQLSAVDNTAELKGHFIPESDNTFDLGNIVSGDPRRWRKIYSNSGTIGTSDEREKHDIHPADPEMLRKFIMALDAEWFRLDALPDEQMIGFIAQKFREAMRKAGMPDDFGGFVDESPDHSHLALRYDQVIAPLVSVAQQQQHRIDDLEQRLAALEKRIG